MAVVCCGLVVLGVGGFWAGSFRDFGLGFVGDLFLGCRGIRFLSLCCLKFALLMPVASMCLMVLC